MGVAPVLVAWCASAALVAACSFDSRGVAVAASDAAAETGRADAAPRPDAFVVACAGPLCACESADTCAASCAGDDCTMRCAGAGTCANQCGDDCTHACESSGACLLSCGDGCAARCESVGACAVVCGRDCAVDCRDTSSCSVTMTDGVVNCERTTSCEATCRDPGGARRPARRGAGGALFCDAAVD